MKIRRNQVMDYVRILISNSKAIADGYKFEEIQDYCMNQEIEVDEAIIIDFLNKKAKEAGIDINENVESLGWVTISGENIENLITRSCEKIKKQIEMSRYEFNSIDLKYFKDCFRIYKEKCLKLCSLIEMLQGRIETDRKLLKSLDISYNADFVSTEDIDRIVNPLICNFCKAYETCMKANDLSTYLTVTVNENAMARDGINYWELLPSKLLQNKDGFAMQSNQFIALSDRQIEEAKNKRRKNIKASFDTFLLD